MDAAQLLTDKPLPLQEEHVKLARSPVVPLPVHQEVQPLPLFQFKIVGIQNGLPTVIPLTP